MRVSGALRSAAAAGVLVTAALVGPARSDTAAPDVATAPAGGASSRTALLVFVSYRGNLRVPIHPTDVRLAATGILAADLADRGRTVVTVPELEPLMRRLRLRSEGDLSREALRSLADDFGADELVVARLVADDDRILLLGRALSTSNGWLRWAAVEEEPGGSGLWTDPAAAGDRLAAMVTAAAGRLTASESPRPVAEPAEGIVPLPLETYGLDRNDTDLAQLALLRSLLAAGHWHVPDPALVVDEMQRGGFDPRLLSAAARTRLAEDFESGSLLVSRLNAFPPSGTSSSGVIPADDDFAGAAAPRVRRESPVLFTLALLDARTGRTLAGPGAYLEPGAAQGIFGIIRAVPSARRYEETADVLVRSLSNGEGSG